MVRACLVAFLAGKPCGLVCSKDSLVRSLAASARALHADAAPKLCGLRWVWAAGSAAVTEPTWGLLTCLNIQAKMIQNPIQAFRAEKRALDDEKVEWWALEILCIKGL